MSKLTKAEIEHVAKRYVGEQLDPLFAAHNALGVELVIRTLDAVYGKNAMGVYVHKLPKAFHQFSKEFYVRTSRGLSLTVHLKASIVTPAPGSALPLRDEALGDELTEWVTKRAELVKAERHLLATTIGTVSSFGSRVKLRADWPEAAKFLPAEPAPKPIAVRPDAIDAALADVVDNLGPKAAAVAQAPG